jgi:hypothetical protein
MKTVNWILENTPECWEVVAKVMRTFPCWVNPYEIDSYNFGVEILCREEDLPAIENFFAEFV